MTDEDKINLEESNIEAAEEPQTEIEKMKQECEEYKAGWMRAQADYQNLKKETETRRREWAQMSEAQILEEFIPVYGNFKIAFGHEIKDGQFENWKKGIEYIMKQFGDILKQHAVEEIKTVGEKFNPELHEAIGEEESDKESGTIVREIEGGYKVGGKILRCAKVIIAK